MTHAKNILYASVLVAALATLASPAAAQGHKYPHLMLCDPQTADYTELQRWQDATLVNDKERQVALLTGQNLPPPKFPAYRQSNIPWMMEPVPPQTEYAQWRDDSIFNNKVRQQMGLWPI